MREALTMQSIARFAFVVALVVAATLRGRVTTRAVLLINWFVLAAIATVVAYYVTGAAFTAMVGSDGPLGLSMPVVSTSSSSSGMFSSCFRRRVVSCTLSRA